MGEYAPDVLRDRNFLFSKITDRLWGTWGNSKSPPLTKPRFPIKSFGGSMNWQRGICWLPLLTLVLLVASCAKKTPALNLMVWEGYADPAFIKAFEDSNHCRISASYMGSSDELVAKLKGGSAGNYDVISPSSDVATFIATSGLAAPLDLSKIPTYEQLSP